MIAHLDTFSHAILTALGSGMLVAAVLAVPVAAIARTMRPSATTRHVLWWIVFTSAAVLPVASLATSFGRIEHHRAVAATGSATSAYETAGSHTRSNAGVRAALPATTMHGGRGIYTSSSSDLQATFVHHQGAQSTDWLAVFGRVASAAARIPGLPSAVVAVWLIVAIVRLASLIPGFVWLIGIKRAAIPLDESIVKRLRRYRYGTRTGRPATIALSADIDVPIAVGFGKPAILLPIRVAETETIADLDQIVMHEHAHLNRYDDVTNLVQQVVERLFWFNPVIALAGRRIALEREIACDDSVVAQTGRAHRYATCLWKLVESATLPARPVMAPGALLTPKQITRRIEQLLDSKRNALPRLSPASAIALSALGASLIFFQAQRAPVIALEDPIAPIAPVVPVVPLHVTPAVPITPIVHPAIALRASAVVHPAHIAPLAPIAPIAPIAPHAAVIRISPHVLANSAELAAAARSVHVAKSIAAGKAAELAALGANMGIDVAKEISESLVPASEWPKIERSLDHAQNEVSRTVALHDMASNDDDGTSPSKNHRDLSSFRRIEVDGSFDVIVRRGSTSYVDFQGDTEVESHTRTRVEGESLIVSQRDGSYTNEHHKPMIVYTSALDRVEIDGSANVTVESASGDRFGVDISGSGDLVASGSVATADVHIEGSGDANLLQLIASTIRVNSEGSGDVRISAPNSLRVRLDGSGDVDVRGTPKHLASHVDGSGSIVQI